MEVNVDKIVVAQSGIWLGLQIHGPKKSWVRFAKVLVRADIIPWEELDALRLESLSTDAVAHQDEPLF